MLGGIDSVAPFITVNEQSESNPDCSFHSSIASFASGRSYHQNLLILSLSYGTFIPLQVYRGHTPHFCNFVQQVPLHSKNGGATDSTGIPDSDIDEMEFITESIEGRLINKWRKGSTGRWVLPISLSFLIEQY